MGVFDNLERKLEGVVNGAFARAFKGDVQPVEITARLQKELDAEARMLSRDRKLVPNDFTIGLSSHDYDRLVPYSRTLNQDIIPQLREYAANAGYIFNGPVTIAYEQDADLPLGRFTVLSQAVAAAAGDGPVRQDYLAAWGGARRRTRGLSSTGGRITSMWCFTKPSRRK